MSIENAIITNSDITIGTSDNKLENVYTNSIDINGISIFREKNSLYKKNEKNNNITKLVKNNGQQHRWCKIKEYDDYVYLDGNLILDNTNIFLNGVITDNVNINFFENNIDNNHIDSINLCSSIISDKFNDRNIDTNGIVVNNAWKKIESDIFFCSKNLVINGNLYVKKIPNNTDLNGYIEELNDRNYSYDSIIDGYTDWKTLDDLSTYTNKKIFIAGNILVASNIIKITEDYNILYATSNAPVIETREYTIRNQESLAYNFSINNVFIGSNIHIILNKGDTLYLVNISRTHPIAIKDTSNNIIATETEKELKYIFTSEGEYEYYCILEDTLISGFITINAELTEEITNLVYSCNVDYNSNEIYKVEEPYKSVIINEIGIKDNLKITDNDIILSHNKITLLGNDEINISGNNIYFNGNINFENSLSIGENFLYNDKLPLIIYKNSENKDVNIVEFWDSKKTATNDNGSGVIIGKFGITLIGVTENNNVIPDESAQLHVMSDVTTQNRVEVSGNYYRNTIINNNGNVLIANNEKFSNRINVTNLIIPEYSLDVNGDTFINGSLLLKHNNIIKGFFSVDNNILQNTTSNVMNCYFTWGISKENSSNIYKPINLDVDYYITSTNTNTINYKQQKFSILINPRNNEELNMPNLITAFPRDGASMSIYRKTEVYSERLDYNSIILTFNTHFATFENEESFSSIAYANITVTGDNIFNQFYISNKIDFYGILDIENIDPINLVVRPGTHKINIYDKYNITQYDTASFELSNLDPMLSNEVYLDEMFLYIKSTNTTRSYNFDIIILNRLKKQLSNSIKIHCDEINLITINTLQLSCNIGYVINEFRLNLYNFYEISTIYDWNILKDCIFFESSTNINIDQNTSELIITSSLSGQYCNIEIDIALLNSEETNKIKIANSKIYITYEEGHKIVLNNHFNQINFNSYEYDEIVINKLFFLSNYNLTTIALDTQIYNINDLEEESLKVEYSNITCNLYNIIEIDNNLHNYSNFININYISQQNNTDIIASILIDRYTYNSNYYYNIELYSNLELNTRLNIDLLQFYTHNQEFLRFSQSDLIHENIINLSINHINTSIQIEAYYVNNYDTSSNSDLILHIVNF